MLTISIFVALITLARSSASGDWSLIRCNLEQSRLAKVSQVFEEKQVVRLDDFWGTSYFPVDTICLSFAHGKYFEPLYQVMTASGCIVGDPEASFLSVMKVGNALSHQDLIQKWKAIGVKQLLLEDDQFESEEMVVKLPLFKSLMTSGYFFVGIDTPGKMLWIKSPVENCHSSE